ncbi:hypothetical protein GCM10009836_09660 [Pseudonocardia ailaonensis]|uniref:MOSC domain-containing protein n=1 Tax=Pseudonocardia ailaonensis TaxID=367279 RepID=A0ABN2MPV1_9PSEU
MTVIAAESLDAVAAELGAGPLDPALTRRTIVLRGAEVDTLVGSEFTLDSGDGPVRFRATRAANPCRWMDVVLAPGAFRALRRRGGIRCTPLTDGVLRRGPVTFTVDRAAETA